MGLVHNGCHRTWAYRQVVVPIALDRSHCMELAKPLDNGCHGTSIFGGTFIDRWSLYPGHCAQDETKSGSHNEVAAGFVVQLILSALFSDLPYYYSLVVFHFCVLQWNL